MGVPAGSLLSTLTFALFSTMLPEHDFLAWGWRIPLLLSGALIAVGLFVRLKVLESPAFERVRSEKAESRVPLLDLFREHPRELLLGLAMRVGQGVVYYLYTVFILSYGTKLGYSRQSVLTGVAIAAILGFGSIPLWASLSDRVGRRPVYLAGTLFSALYAVPFFWLVALESPAVLWLALILGMNVGHDLTYGPQAAYFTELFGARVRYIGASLDYRLASLVGGLAPLIATLLLAAFGYFAVAGFLAVCCLLSFVAPWMAPGTHRKPLG